jgi:hypothetical protein
VKRHFSKNRV